MVFTKLAFWKAVAERAVKTAAQAVVVGWAVGDGAFNAFEVDWQLGLGLAAGGAVASLLTSLASIPVGLDGPSFGKAEMLKPPPAEAQASIDLQVKK